MNSFLDIIYYGLPILATLFVAAKIEPKFKNDWDHGKINVFYILVVLFIGGVIFILNALAWATAAFFAIRG